MSIIMIMKWSGVTPDQYDQLRRSVKLEEDVPVGVLTHVAAFDDNCIHVVDTWETADDFNNYVKKRLLPEVQKLGINSQPEIGIYSVHATFYPNQL